MGFYDNYILPKIIDCACGQAAMQQQRQWAVPQARGAVLEVGIGSGLNLPYYNIANVQRIIGVDPSAALLAKARRRGEALTVPLQLLQQGAEQITLPDASVDSVLLTFTLCSIPLVGAALTQMHRVLKPDGTLIFCEHGKAPDSAILRWQNRLNPVWKRCFGGCHLNRDTPALLREHGFRLDRMEASYMPDTPRIAGYIYRGSARPA